jgi:predicted amidohydrolase
MATDTATVLLAQLTPSPRDPAANAARVARIVGERPDAEIAVFPELFLGGYTLRHLDEVAMTPDAGPLAAIAAAAAAARTAVVVGFAERLDAGVSNAAACFDADGSLAGVYRKTHLFGAEAEAFTAGDEQLVVPLAGVRVAPLICFAIELPVRGARGRAEAAPSPSHQWSP